MAEDNGNGQGQIDGLFPEGVDIAEVKAQIHGNDSTTNALKPQENENAINLIMTQAQEFVDNALRMDIPSNEIALYISLSIQRCTQNHYSEGVLFWKYVCGLLTSVKAKRVNLAGDIIIGERQWKAGVHNNGFMQKAKDFMTGQ